jgi:hypothetical protein
MRNLLLLLLLANVLYFVWGMFASDTTEPGVAIVEESELGPPMEVTVATGAETIASVGEILGSGEASDLAAVVGRSCVTIGPFRMGDREAAAAAQMQYAGEGMRASLRPDQGQIFIGHWVSVQKIGDDVLRGEMMTTLKQGGLVDAYEVTDDDGSLGISLGLFGEMEGAEKVELQAKSLGLPAAISPMTREGTVYFVDVALPPGKGASAIVDRYGEDRVFLRDAATCPQNH